MAKLVNLVEDHHVLLASIDRCMEQRWVWELIAPEEISRS